MNKNIFTHIEQAETAYNQYLSQGQTYHHACLLKTSNLEIRASIETLLPDLPLLLRSSAQELIEHYDSWIRLWIAHEKTAAFAPNNQFIFPTEVPFPNTAYHSLTTYLRLQTLEILFIGKKGDPKALKAAEYLKQIYPQSIIVFGERGCSFPEELNLWQGDYIFSYLSPWIIPSGLLERAAQGAINWHPGPPSYPGIGCTNFAIYNQEQVFGITCHYMAPKVDTGSIIEVRSVAILASDTVFSLTQKCYTQIECSFISILEHIATGIPLPISTLNWSRAPYTRKELNALCRIEPSMSSFEICRRIQATTYDKSWAYTEIGGQKFFVL